MGNKICLVINYSRHDIIIKEWMKCYCKDLKEVKEYSFDKILEPRKYASYNPSELKKKWKMDLRLLGISSEIRVSFEDNNSREEVLSISEFKDNKGIVLNRGENNQLVKELVSRREAKESKEETKSSWKNKEKLKEHLISIVEKRNIA